MSLHTCSIQTATCIKSKIQLSFLEVFFSVVSKKVMNMQSSPGVWSKWDAQLHLLTAARTFFGSSIDTAGTGFCWWTTSAQHHFPRSDGADALCVCVFHHPSLHFPGLSDKKTWLCSRGRRVLPWHCPVWHWILSLVECFWWVRQRLCQKAPEEAHLGKELGRRQQAGFGSMGGVEKSCGRTQIWVSKGNFLGIQRSFCSYGLLPWEAPLDWEQGRKKGWAMHRRNEQGWDLFAVSMFHLAEPTFLFLAVVCCPSALTMKFKSALCVLAFLLGAEGKKISITLLWIP